MLLALLVIFEERKHSLFVPHALLATGISFVLTELVIKNIFGRIRPLSLYTSFFTACPSSFSFPSGHATIAFASATVFSYYDKRRIVFYYILATCIAFSRLYLGCHYLSDLLVGALLGFFVAKTVLNFSFRARR